MVVVLAEIMQGYKEGTDRAKSSDWVEQGWAEKASKTGPPLNQFIPRCWYLYLWPRSQGHLHFNRKQREG